MKKTILLSSFLILLGFSCEKKVNETTLALKEGHTINQVNSIVDLEVYDFEGFRTFLEKRDDKIYVINFWATWCGPCVKELPYFEKLYKKYRNNNVEVILVSLDFPHLYESKLKPFITDNKLESKVIALDDVDANSWIPKVDKNWTGSIPATVIYRNEDAKFYEQSFTYEALENEVKQFIN